MFTGNVFVETEEYLLLKGEGWPYSKKALQSQG